MAVFKSYGVAGIDICNSAVNWVSYLLCLLAAFCQMLHLVVLCELAFQASCQAMTVHVLQLSATAAQAKALPLPHASNTCSERNIHLTLIARQG